MFLYIRYGLVSLGESKSTATICSIPIHRDKHPRSGFRSSVNVNLQLPLSILSSSLIIHNIRPRYLVDYSCFKNKQNQKQNALASACPERHTGNMIEEADRYFSLSGDASLPRGPSTWHITDWDRRCTISVTMDGLQDEEDEAVSHYRRYGNDIPPHVYRIYVSSSGDIISTFTNPEDDQTT